MVNEEKNEKIRIAYAPDDKYASLVLVSMVSVLENTQKDIEFIILYSSLSDKSFEMLNFVKKYSNCEIIYKQIDETIFNDVTVRSSATIQARFMTLLPDLFPEYDKCIYFDCDVLVNGDINEFWEIDISEHIVAAVKDLYSVVASSERLKLTSNSYFSSGVLLINCKKCRDIKFFDKFVECANTCPDIQYGEQDILNKIFDEDKILVSQIYNYMEAYWINWYHEYQGEDAEEYEKAKTTPLIIHYTGWKPNDPRSHHSLKNLWWKYAEKTDYYSEYVNNFLMETNIYVNEIEDYNKNVGNRIKETEESKRELQMKYDNLIRSLNSILYASKNGGVEIR